MTTWLVQVFNFAGAYMAQYQLQANTADYACLIAKALCKVQHPEIIRPKFVATLSTVSYPRPEVR